MRLHRLIQPSGQCRSVHEAIAAGSDHDRNCDHTSLAHPKSLQVTLDSRIIKDLAALSCIFACTLLGVLRLVWYAAIAGCTQGFSADSHHAMCWSICSTNPKTHQSQDTPIPRHTNPKTPFRLVTCNHEHACKPVLSDVPEAH